MLKIMRRATVHPVDEQKEGEEAEALVPLDVDEDFENRTENARRWIRDHYLDRDDADPGDELHVVRTTWRGTLEVERRVSVVDIGGGEG